METVHSPSKSKRQQVKFKQAPNPSKHPFCTSGHEYAKRVVSKEQVACIHVWNACKRYLDDLARQDTATFYMDWDKAERYLRLVQKFKHSEGHWKTPYIVYEPWQNWVFLCIMGFYSKVTGYRRFRVAHLEIARGNGKSVMASQALLFFLSLDSPNGNMVSTVATKRDQARIVLDSARAMAAKNNSFLAATGTEVLAHSIVHKESHSVARAMSADHGSLDGLKDVLAVCDELHAMNRSVFEVVYSGMSKRKDSLLLCITTAGSNTESVGYYQSVYARKVASGEVVDDSFFSAVYTLDEGDDWADEAVWVKANPNLGVSVDTDSLRAKVSRAMVTPSDVPNLKIKHFNQWISEAFAYYDLNKWDACSDPSLKLEDFHGEDCYLGFDIGSHKDLTAIAYVFMRKKKFFIFTKNFIPEGAVLEARNALYDNCIADGSLIKTKGDVTNFDLIREELTLAAKNFKVYGCMFDPWNALEMAQKLEGTLEMVKFPMNVSNLSAPMKKLDALIRDGEVAHPGSQIYRWCLGNVTAKEDANGNVFPRKTHERLKIDPVVATLMALAGWLHRGDGDRSVYETRGLLSLSRRNRIQ